MFNSKNTIWIIGAFSLFVVICGVSFYTYKKYQKLTWEKKKELAEKSKKGFFRKSPPTEEEIKKQKLNKKDKEEVWEGTMSVFKSNSKSKETKKKDNEVRLNSFLAHLPSHYSVIWEDDNTLIFKFLQGAAYVFIDTLRLIFWPIKTLFIYLIQSLRYINSRDMAVEKMGTNIGVPGSYLITILTIVLISCAILQLIGSASGNPDDSKYPVDSFFWKAKTKKKTDILISPYNLIELLTRQTYSIVPRLIYGREYGDYIRAYHPHGVFSTYCSVVRLLYYLKEFNFSDKHAQEITKIFSDNSSFLSGKGWFYTKEDFDYNFYHQSNNKFYYQSNNNQQMQQMQQMQFIDKNHQQTDNDY